MTEEAEKTKEGPFLLVIATDVGEITHEMLETKEAVINALMAEFGYELEYMLDEDIETFVGVFDLRGANIQELKPTIHPPTLTLE